LLSSGATSWSNKKQKSVALSTAEAEYTALSGAAQECIWLRQLEDELGSPSEGPTLIFEDNQSTIAMAKNSQFHGHAKHIDIHHHFIREQVELGTIKLDYCPTIDMTADMMTKGLNREQHCKLREKVSQVRRSIGNCTVTLRLNVYTCTYLYECNHVYVTRPAKIDHVGTFRYLRNTKLNYSMLHNSPMPDSNHVRFILEVQQGY